MTCVAGYFDRKTNAVYLAGDSCGSNSYTHTVYSQKKVFHSQDTKSLIVGLCGSFNFQALEYESLLDELALLKKTIDRKYLVTTFVPKIKELTVKYNLNENKSGVQSMPGPLLFGYHNQLFMVQSDFSLLETTRNFNAVGSGAEAALGSLFASEILHPDMSPIDRLVLALQAAEDICCGVKGPYIIINTKNDELIRVRSDGARMEETNHGKDPVPVPAQL